MKLIDGEAFFTVSEVAKLFGKSVSWFYFAEKAGYFTDDDGDLIVFKRTNSGTRLISPTNVVDMADALVDKKLWTLDQYFQITGEMSKYRYL